MSRDLYIVDDNPDHHFLMYQVIKQLDKPYLVKFFEDGKMLYRHLDSLIHQEGYNHFPGLIILDLNMPGMNGMQLLKLIKQPATEVHDLLRDIPVIVMSSDTREDKIQQCYQKGADAYIIKPFTYDQIKYTMKGICRFWLDPVASDTQLS